MSRESSGRTGGRPGGSGQVRGRTSGRTAEVGGAQSSCDCPDNSSQCGSIHSTFRSRGRGEFVADHSRRVDPGTGQFARTCSVATACSHRTQSDGVGCGATEPRGPSEVMAILIEEADRSTSPGSFCTVLRACEGVYKSRLRGLL